MDDMPEQLRFSNYFSLALLASLRESNFLIGPGGLSGLGLTLRHIIQRNLQGFGKRRGHYSFTVPPHAGDLLLTPGN